MLKLHVVPLPCYDHAVAVILMVNVPDHDGGRPIEVNACMYSILITHMVYL